MKKIAWLLTLILTLGIFAGCGNKQTQSSNTSTNTTSSSEASKSEPVKIQFMETLTSPERTEYVKTLISDFESKNPDIKVELISVPWEQAHDKLLTQIATNQTPDIVEMNDNWKAEFQATGKLENLLPYFDKWQSKDNFTPAVIKSLKTDDSTLLAIPYGLFIRAMFYREDWLKENNMSLPKTYDELFDTAKKLTDKSKNRYGYSFRGGAGAWTQLINVIMTQSGHDNYFDKDGKSILRDPKAIEAFKKYADLYKTAAPKDALNWGYNEKVNAFTSNVTGFLMQDSEVITTTEKTMKQGTFATAPLPVGPDGKRYMVMGSIGYSMFSTSKNKEASWKFISYMLSDEVLVQWNKKTNTMPVVKAALSDEYFNKGYIKAWTEEAADPNTVYFMHPLFLPEWGQFFTKESVTGLQNYLLGKQTAEETMNKWATYLEDAYKKYNNK